ncbi:MAG: hypothetical protein AB8U93_07380 [Francisella endosymbiont of Hyalomma scupense]
MLLLSMAAGYIINRSLQGDALPIVDSINGGETQKIKGMWVSRINAGSADRDLKYATWKSL